MHIAQRQTSIEPTECEIVDQLVEYVNVCQREVVVNYYVEAASHSEAEGLAFPFFAGIERMSPAEVVCYFHDLPRGLLWQADASTVQVDLPKNLYITGTLNMEERDGLVQIPEVDHYATIIRVDRRHFAPFAGPRKASPQRSAGQHRFARSVIRRGDHARAKLTQILPDGYAPLAPLNELLRRLGMAGFSPFVFEEALLYLANAFHVPMTGSSVHRRGITSARGRAERMLRPSRLACRLLMEGGEQNGEGSGLRDDGRP